MTDNKEPCGRGDLAALPQRDRRASDDRAIETHQRPIGAVRGEPPSDEARATVDVVPVKRRARRLSVGHAEAENEANADEVLGALHAVAGRRDDVGRDEEAGTEAADRLVDERLAPAKLVIGLKRRRREREAAVAEPGE